MLFTALNPIGAYPGDTVVVSTDSKPVLAAAAVLYILPLILFFLGYLLGACLWESGAVTGTVGFVLGVCVAVVYDRCVEKKRKAVYTITGFDSCGS